MKKITSLAVSFLLISGCSQSLENTKFDKSVETPLSTKADVAIQRTLSSIQIRNGLYFAPNENEPFTGKYIGDSNGLLPEKLRHLGLESEKQELTFVGGKRNGLTITWFKNGQKKSETNYKDGKEDGLSLEWYENGHKKGETNYKNGKKEGIETTWFKYIKKRSEGNYKNNQKDGIHTNWFENGQKGDEFNYKDDKREGLQKTWFKQNGQQNEEFYCKNDERDGLRTVWFENGQKQTEELYSDGHKVKVISLFDENGNKITPELVTSPHNTQSVKTATYGAKIKPSKSPCDDISDLALQIMRGRQNGTAMSKMMQIAEDNKLIQAMVIAAYEKNRYSTEEVQTKIIEEFRDDAHLQCVKALR